MSTFSWVSNLVLFVVCLPCSIPIYATIYAFIRKLVIWGRISINKGKKGNELLKIDMLLSQEQGSNIPEIDAQMPSIQSETQELSRMPYELGEAQLPKSELSTYIHRSIYLDGEPIDHSWYRRELQG